MKKLHVLTASAVISSMLVASSIAYAEEEVSKGYSIKRPGSNTYHYFAYPGLEFTDTFSILSDSDARFELSFTPLFVVDSGEHSIALPEGEMDLDNWVFEGPSTASSPTLEGVAHNWFAMHDETFEVGAGETDWFEYDVMVPEGTPSGSYFLTLTTQRQDAEAMSEAEMLEGEDAPAVGAIAKTQRNQNLYVHVLPAEYEEKVDVYLEANSMTNKKFEQQEKERIKAEKAKEKAASGDGGPFSNPLTLFILAALFLGLAAYSMAGSDKKSKSKSKSKSKKKK